MAVPQISSSLKGSCSHESNTPRAMTITPKEVSQSALGVWGLSLEAPKVTTLKRAFWSFSMYFLGFRVHQSNQGPQGVRVAVWGFPRSFWEESLAHEADVLKLDQLRHCRKSPLLVLAHIPDQRPAPEGQFPVLTREGVHARGDSGPRWTQSAIPICAQWHWCCPLV